jgi:hypothetical protein
MTRARLKNTLEMICEVWAVTEYANFQNNSSLYIRFRTACDPWLDDEFVRRMIENQRPAGATFAIRRMGWLEYRWRRWFGSKWKTVES